MRFDEALRGAARWHRSGHTIRFGRIFKMAYVKKNPWILLVGVFAILVAVGIATT